MRGVIAYRCCCLLACVGCCAYPAEEAEAQEVAQEEWRVDTEKVPLATKKSVRFLSAPLSELPALTMTP